MTLHTPTRYLFLCQPHICSTTQCHHLQDSLFLLRSLYPNSNQQSVYENPSVIHPLSFISLPMYQIILQTPPTPSSLPVLTFSVSPNFVLDLTTTSLMGSRAKLANVPKLHELIQHQARRVLLAHTTWKVVLPRLANMEKEVKENKLSSS